MANSYITPDQEIIVRDIVNPANELDTIQEISNMSFFYIGNNQSIVDHFTNYFESGYKEESLYEAGNLIHQFYLLNKKLPDVLFIDIPYDEAEFKHFFCNLKNNILFASLPVIYNERQLTNKQIDHLRQLELIDDVVSINSNHINYASKVIFLKQSKLYNQLFATQKPCASKKNRKKNFSFFIKRVMDILIASLGLIILSPVFLLASIAILLESKGPVFYTSLRAGKGFKVFKFYKFRSMVPDADKEVDKLLEFNQYSNNTGGPKFFKVNNDPRVTKLGKFLRNTSADELPQLLNVLKGDMSLVGNRPLPIYEAVTLTTNEFVERFSAPAGITGLWQINKRGKADMSVEERINLDITYSRKCSVFYDLKIMMKTPVALFQKSDV